MSRTVSRLARRSPKGRCTCIPRRPEVTRVFAGEERKSYCYKRCCYAPHRSVARTHETTYLQVDLRSCGHEKMAH